MTHAIEIQPVTNRRQLEQFVKVPWTVNAGDPNWVPPLVHDRLKLLDAAQNPFFKNNPAILFVATKSGKPAGRIAAMINRAHNELRGDQTGFFGFFDAVNDHAVFAELLRATEEWLRAHGCDSVLGPVSPDTNNELGVLVDGFDSPPYFMLAHNPPYYNDLFSNLGYAKARDFYSYIIRCADFSAEGKLSRVAHAIQNHYPIKLRAGDIHRLDSELATIGEIYNNAFSQHWGFVPMTADDIRFFSQDIRSILDTNLVLFAEYAGEPVGFLLALPNINEVLQKIPDGQLWPYGWLIFLLNRRLISSVRVLTVGIKQKFQSFGLGSLLYVEIAKRIIERGYTHVEMSWVSEDNMMMNRAARLLGGRLYKTYRLYEKKL